MTGVVEHKRSLRGRQGIAECFSDFSSLYWNSTIILTNQHAGKYISTLKSNVATVPLQLLEFFLNYRYVDFWQFWFCIVFLSKVSTGSATDLFSTGKHLEPTIATLPDGGLILCRDDMSIITDMAGKHTQKHSLTWSDTPIAISKYTVSVLYKYIIVMSHIMGLVW
jgi:hypothetical protein